jgi:hypothetical protein
MALTNKEIELVYLGVQGASPAHRIISERLKKQKHRMMKYKMQFQTLLTSEILPKGRWKLTL